MPPGRTVLCLAFAAIAIVGVAARTGLHHTAGATTPAGTVPPVVDERFVGRWVSPQGKRILVTRTGAVWADPDLLGQIASVSNDRIVLAGADFWCSYVVAFPSRDVAEWTLTDNTQSTSCPAGHFERSFTF